MPVDVGDGGDRQVDLGTQDHEGEADGHDPGDRDLASGCSPHCPVTRSDRLVRQKKATSTIKVANGAMMRIWLRQAEQAPSRRHVTPPPAKLVLADGLAGEFVHDARPSSSPTMRSASDSTVSGSVDSTTTPHALIAQPFDDAHHVLLGADIHAARRLRSAPAPWAARSATWRAPPSAGCRPTGCRAASRPSAAGSDSDWTCRRAMSFSTAGRSSRRPMRPSTLIDMFL